MNIINRRKYLLLIGLPLVIVSVILTFLCVSAESYIHRDIHDVIKNSSILKVLLFSCVIAPITEELSFRYWAVGSIFSKTISIIGISVFTYNAFDNWIIVVLVLIVSTFLLFALKKGNLQFIIMVIFSSALFTSLHDVFFTIPDISNVMSKIGISLIFIYMVLRWNIFAAIGLHFAWNFVVIGVPLLIAPMLVEEPIKPQSIISESMNVKMEQVEKVRDTRLPDMRIIESDSVILTNASMTEIVRCLSARDDSKYVLVDNIDEVRYNVIGSISSERDLVSLRDSIVRRLDVVFDTVKPSNRFLIMNFDDVKQESSEEDIMHVPVPLLISRLEELYNKRVVFAKMNYSIPMTKKSYYAFGDEDDRDKALLILKEQGISVLKPDETDIEFVVITGP